MELIFVPGLLCTKQVFGKLCQLEDKYEITYHIPEKSTFIRGFAKQVVESVDPCKEYGLIGISMGGYIALEIARKNFNWLKKLVLINTTFKEVDPTSIQEREKAIKFAEAGDMKALINSSKGFCFLNKKQEYLELEIEMAEQIGLETYVDQQKAIISRNSCRQYLPNIDVETLIISSKEDPVLDYKDSLEMFFLLPNAQISVFSGCGHLPTLEKPQETFDVVSNFLERR